METKRSSMDRLKGIGSTFRPGRQPMLMYLWLAGLVIIGLGIGFASGRFPLPLPLRTAAAVEKTPEPAETIQRPPSQNLLKLSQSDIPLLQSLHERQVALEDREQRVTEREAELQQLQQHLEEKFTTLSMLRKEIGALVKERDAFEERRFGHLVKVYEGMKPAEAAPLVERLKQETAVKLFYRMKEKKVSRILGFIKPEIAARLSERLAAYRNTNEQDSRQEER